jgi:hypothetical protein
MRIYLRLNLKLISPGDFFPDEVESIPQFTDQTNARRIEGFSVSLQRNAILHNWAFWRIGACLICWQSLMELEAAIIPSIFGQSRKARIEFGEVILDLHRTLSK